MITQTGFVLCRVTGEYEDTVVTPIAFSDSLKELNDLIEKMNRERSLKIESHKERKNTATKLVQDLNEKFEKILAESKKNLVLESLIPKPEKWPPITGKEHYQWGLSKTENGMIDARNRKRIMELNEALAKKFVIDNPIPQDLGDLIVLSKFGQLFSVLGEPSEYLFTIHSLELKSQIQW